MQVRFPWILSRKRLIIAVIIDGILFTTLCYKFFYLRFDRLPGLSFRLALLLTFWMLCSYVSGRFTSGYSKLQFGAGVSLFRQISGTALTLALR